MKQLSIKKSLLFLLSLFVTQLYCSEKQSLFSSLSKKEKIIVIVTGGVVITYTVYKVGEYTVRTVQSVYQKYQEYKLEQLVSKAKNQSKELEKNTQNFAEVLNTTEGNTERDIQYLKDDNFRSQEQLGLMEDINHTTNSTANLIKEAFVKDQGLMNLRGTFISRSKDIYDGIVDYSEQKKACGNYEADLFKQHKAQSSRHANSIMNINKSITETHEKIKNQLNQINKLSEKNN